MLFALAPASLVSVLFVGGAVAAGVLALWTIRYSALAISGLVASLIIGQAWRLPLPGQGGGLLLSDVAALLVIVSAIGVVCRCYWQKVLHTERRTIFSPDSKIELDEKRTPNNGWRTGGPPSSACSQQTKPSDGGAGVDRTRSRIVFHEFSIILLWALPFILWSLWTLAIQAPVLGGDAMVIAAAYWVRLVVSMLVVPALVILCVETGFFCTLSRGIIATILIVLGTGIVQLLFLPRLSVLGGGWDPHDGRLVATWLDPNFLGVLLAVAMPYVFILFRQRSTRLSGLALILGALALTQSRSAAVALIGVAALLSPWYLMHWLNHRPALLMPRLLAGAALVVVLLLTTIGWWGERAYGVIYRDPTVALRQESLRAAWPIVARHTVVGVGYNAYQFTAHQEQLINDFTIHSRAGTDNSWLNLWITTGLVGLLLFTLPWLWVTYHLLHQSLGVAMAWITSLLIWWISAHFINSLLYSHLILFMALLAAYSVASTKRISIKNELQITGATPGVPRRAPAVSRRSRRTGVQGVAGPAQASFFTKL